MFMYRYIQIQLNNNVVRYISHMSCVVQIYPYDGLFDVEHSRIHKGSFVTPWSNLQMVY